jgi:hypothetical protein
MSLKNADGQGATGRCMPRVDEHRHAEFGAIEFGRNQGVRRGELESPLVDRDEETYGLVEGTLQSQQYRKLNKGQKGIVRRFLIQVTGLSRAQITRLVGCWMKQRYIPPKAAVKRRRFARR